VKRCTRCRRFLLQLVGERFVLCAACRAVGRDKLEARFWSKVDRSAGEDACWPWLAALRRGDVHRTGQFAIGPRPHAAHRVAWMLTRGPIPPGILVLHRCDGGTTCMNPAHMFLGTSADFGVLYARRHPGPLSADVVARVRELHAAGKSVRAIAKDVGSNKTTIGEIVSGQKYRFT
jgi:hypothetical protein